MDQWQWGSTPAHTVESWAAIICGNGCMDFNSKTNSRGKPIDGKTWSKQGYVFVKESSSNIQYRLLNQWITIIATSCTPSHTRKHMRQTHMAAHRFKNRSIRSSQQDMKDLVYHRDYYKINGQFWLYSFMVLKKATMKLQASPTSDIMRWDQ